MCNPSLSPKSAPLPCHWELTSRVSQVGGEPQESSTFYWAWFLQKTAWKWKNLDWGQAPIRLRSDPSLDALKCCFPKRNVGYVSGCGYQWFGGTPYLSHNMDCGIDEVINENHNSLKFYTYSPQTIFLLPLSIVSWFLIKCVWECRHLPKMKQKINVLESSLWQ